MSLRPSPVRKTSKPNSPPDRRFIITIGRGDRTRRVCISPPSFYAIATVIPVLAIVYLAATAYLFFRDDMIAGLMARHAHQQYAYEDRLAALRLQLDRVAGRQMLDQDSFDGKLREMASRQARIETRASVLAALGSAVAAPTGEAPATSPRPARTGFSFPWSKDRPAPAPAQNNAPIDNPDQASRPRPDDTGLRPSTETPDVDRRASVPTSADLTLADVADGDVSPGLRMGALAKSIDHIERSQVSVLKRIEGPAATLATKLRNAIAATGLTADRLKTVLGGASSSGVGGPYVALRVDPHASEFDAQFARTQAAVVSLESVRKLIPSLPLGRPLAGALEQTSSFGYRLDPFLGRPALHSGLDFRGEYGSAVYATAKGKVVTAGYTGGYGNMVEIEHSNGVSTRYGHLSAILVSEGQAVDSGSQIGRIGSTGRSTGNHLHYEVRLDDEATDPARFIRAAGLLGN